MTAIGRITQRFPLIARPRPACRPLDERVHEVSRLARAAAEAPDAEALSLAAAAHNKAALIASDCGLPDLARSLCWRHAETYLRARPLPARAARYALEPIINLARLKIRDGDGNGAHRLLDALYHAVHTRTDAVIDGRKVPLQNLTRSDEGHRTLGQWLWTILLADGTRALASAGRWDQALAHAESHGGIGRRLLDGRQVAILTRLLAGDPAAALHLLNDSTPTEPWENAIAACLSVLCLSPTTSTQMRDEVLTAMVDRYLRLDSCPELLVFRTRLGLTAIDLADGVEHPHATKVATRLVTQIVACNDGYAARDILAHNECKAWLRETATQALTNAVQSSGLGGGTPSPDLMAKLHASTQSSETTAARILDKFGPEPSRAVRGFAHDWSSNDLQRPQTFRRAQGRILVWPGPVTRDAYSGG